MRCRTWDMRLVRGRTADVLALRVMADRDLQVASVATWECAREVHGPSGGVGLKRPEVRGPSELALLYRVSQLASGSFCGASLVEFVAARVASGFWGRDRAPTKRVAQTRSRCGSPDLVKRRGVLGPLPHFT